MRTWPVGDRRALDEQESPWLAFLLCMRPSRSAAAFDCNAVGGAVWWVIVDFHEALAARKVNKSSDRDEVDADLAGSVADACPTNKKITFILHEVE